MNLCGAFPRYVWCLVLDSGNDLDQKDSTNRFYQAVWPYAPLLLRTALVLTRSQADADDLMQETMLKAFRAINSLRPGSDARAWLLQILRNTRIDRLRRGAHEMGTVSLSQHDLAISAADAQESMDETSWRNQEKLLEAFSDSQVISAIKTLPEEIAWTLLLVDVEGLTHGEASRILNIPEGTVKSRGFRGRQMLRNVLMPLARRMRIVQ